MINLMYLVLTALLALNVSSEILNAFRTVNNSLNNATANIEGKNVQMFNSFDELSKDPTRREQAAVWQAKASKAKQLGDAMNQYIINLQTSLKNEADYNKEKNTYNEGSLEASTRLMIEQGKGQELQDKLKAFKDALLKIDPKFTAESGKTLPIDVEKPKNIQNENNNTFSTAYFHMTPAVAAMTILSKFQNDVKNSESQVVEYCLSQVGRVVFTYDQFQVIANSSATYLMPGEPLTINAGIGAYSSKATPTVTVNGASASRTPAGDYELQTNAETSPGDYVKHVVITYKDPNTGLMKTATKDIKYTVGSPVGASISADAVKVLYVGLDNPISVSGGGVGDEQIHLSMTNGTATKTGSGKYSVRPGKAGVPAVFTLDVKGKPSKFEFKVRDVPDPIAKVGQSKGGRMPVNDFKAQFGVRADLENFIFEGVKFNVTGFTIVLQGNGFPALVARDVTGATFGGIRDIVEKARPGTAVTIDNIEVAGPGGKRLLPPIQFNLY